MALSLSPSFSIHIGITSTTTTTHKFNNPNLKWGTHHYPFPKALTFACSAEKPRKKGKGSRATKSNEEICSELREFILVVGLPEDHIPSVKELSEHGRKDLAYIVRRRGYKTITELLRNSCKNDSNSDKPSIEDHNFSNVCRDEASEVQGRNLIDSDEPVSSSSGCSIVDNYLVRINGAISPNTSVQVCKYPESSMVSLDSTEAKKLHNFEEASEVKNGEMPSESDLKYDAISSNSTPEIAYLASQDAPLLAQHTDRDHSISDQGLEGAQHDGSFASDTAGKRDKTEIDHLKAMLNQKEIELLELKQQIEKEKQALCILQKKANEEINNAHRMLTGKDMELCAAEESLSGLKEVQIVYQGNGETVELAGSFNGWHHRINMDPHPSSHTINPHCSRNFKAWSTILWLYPGIYEIKFIVDGIWRIDPNQEISTSGNITNNILRVEK